MRRRDIVVFALAAVATLAGWRYFKEPAPTLLVVRIGNTFEEVVKHSTYPVMEESNLPAEDPGGNGFGVTWVGKPSVVIKYDDPVNGFILPPTKFAGIPYSRNRVDSIETSPMLTALPFDDTADVLGQLQAQFRSKGWVPWSGDNSRWFDLSAAGRKQLNSDTLRYGSSTITLVVPKKNLEMMLRIKCFNYCDGGWRSPQFLIDVGIGRKSLFNWDGE